MEKHRGFGDSNQETLAELLFSFFRRYGYELNFQTCVISVREARLLSKREKFWDRANNNRLCVEEPFNTDRNLANTADDFAWRGLHLELRRAFQLVAEARDIDGSICEQYEFPLETRPTIERQLPPSRPPTLTRSLSQTGRGGRNSQNTRGNRLQYGRDPNRQPGSNSRRASSAATMGHTPFGPISSAPQSGYPTYNTGFHEHLSQISRQLSQEEYRLRQKLAQQSTAADQMRYNYPGLQQQPQPRPPSLNGYQIYDRNGSADDAPSTAPLPQLGYPYMQWTGSQIAPGWPSPTYTSRGGTDTNPSSPSQTPSALRRGVQRTQLPPSAISAARSQSQPPRSAGLPNGSIQGLGQPASVVPYPTPRYVAQGADGQWYAVDPRREPSVPIEYLGYGFRSQPYYATPTNTQNALQMPPGYWRNVLQHRHTMTTPATADTSRSPSPLRETFTAHQTLPSAPLPQEPFAASASSQQRSSEYGIPMMVNGSFRSERSLGDELHSSNRPRRVSDSVGYYQPQAATWQTNGAALGLNDRYQPSMNSSQELEPFPPAERDRDTYSETATTDDGRAFSEDSSRCGGTEFVESQAPRESYYEDRQPMIVSSSRQPSRQSIPTVQPPPQASGDLAPLANGRKPIPPLDISASLPERLKDEASLNTAKVLSPVQETRTPSPTPKRISRDLNDIARLNGSNGSITSHRPRQLPDPPTPLKPGEKDSRNGDGAVAAGKLDNPWQQVGKKTLKKNNSRGEPIPADVSQRKGG